LGERGDEIKSHLPELINKNLIYGTISNGEFLGYMAVACLVNALERGSSLEGGKKHPQEMVCGIAHIKHNGHPGNPLHFLLQQEKRRKDLKFQKVVSSMKTSFSFRPSLAQ